MNRAQVLGKARHYAWVPLVAMVVAGVLVAAGVLPGGTAGQARPTAHLLAPGSSGSLSHLPWWDPRGWFGGGQSSAPQPRTIAVTGGPQHTRVPRQAAQHPHRVAEIVSKRSADTRVYRLSNGQLQAAISAVPVNYRASGGRWQPIHTAVRQVSKPGYAFGNATNTFRSYFGTSAARGVRLDAPGGGWLQMSLDGARPARPQATGNSVTYPAVAPGTGLGYQVTPQSLRENITLAAPSDSSSYAFTVKVGGGLVPWRESNGEVVFSRTGAGGPPVLVLPSPFMTSARKDAWSPYGYVWSPKVAQQESWDAATHVLRVTLTPDTAWLNAPGRQFPVVIDPTIEIAPTPTDAQNTMIISDSGESTVNYSTSWRLSVGTDGGGASRALLQFPLGTIPAGTQIDSADLRLYYDQNFGTMTANETMEADQATSAWNATTATWANASNNVGTEGLNQIIVDDSDTADTAFSGAWPTAANSTATDGEYRYNQDTHAGDTFTWVPKLTESGDWWVADGYPPTSSAATSAPVTVDYSGGSANYTVNQTSGTGAQWDVLAQQQFAAGTAGKVVLGDGPATASTRVIADAMRFRLWGATTVTPSASSVWDTFPVRNIVQSWVNGSSPNDGFVVKSSTESTLNQGGVRYEGSRFAYNGEVATYPQLVVTYGRPSATLNQITTITSTGADLSWTPYTNPNPTGDPGGNLSEYLVERSVYQSFTPDSSTLVAPVASGTTAFDDTSAPPTPASSSDPFGNAFYYMVAVKTADGQIIPGPTQLARLPKAGYTVQIINASGATTLSKAQPAANEQHLTGEPWLAVGDNSTTFGVTRSVVQYPTMASAGIPAGATITDAELKLWGWYDNNTGGGSATYEAHALTQSFTPSSATWNSASSGTAWTTAGGAYSSTVAGTVSSLTNDPNREEWPVTSVVQGWLNTPSSEHGLLLKQSSETTTGPQEQELFLDTSASEPSLRPELVVTYLSTTPQDTYYSPSVPDRMGSAASYTVPVTVTNTTGTTLSSSNWVVSYHWTQPDGTDVSTSSDQIHTPLPSSLAPGATTTVNAQVTTPDTSTSGDARSAYSLNWDLYNTATSTWLSGTNAGVPAVAPLNQPASVEQPTSNLLGLENFYQYTGVNTGSGSALLNNDDTGNVVWSYNPFSNPSHGFDTFVRLDYNSMDTSDSSMGFGWSLQASTLMRLGTPLDFHPNPSPTTITLTDGDGTAHTFTWNSATSQWQTPPGLNYYLQQVGTCDPNGKTQNSRAWLLTRPDRTQFYFDCQGYQTAMVDNNGNESDFTYTDKNSNNQPVKFLDYITDPSGRQTLTLSYYNKGDSYSYIDSSGNVATGTNLTNPKIIDQVKSITDISGRTITFLYTTQGLMAQLTDGSGSSLAKTFKFGYDMTQGNNNVKLVSVTDPRGNTTGLSYYTAPQDPKFKWSLETITDRLGGTTGFAYSEPTGGGIQTQVTDPDNHTSTYLMDTTGRPVQVTNALNQQTSLTWDGDNNVASLTEPNGAKTTWTYDQNTGYPLTMTSAQANHDGTAGTTYTYQTGLNGHTADLISLLSPQQRLWTFGYDANGNLTSVTDPDGNASGAAAGSYTSKYAYDSLGDLTSATDADGNTTSYADYDPSGYPQQITDATGKTATFSYDSRGNVLSVTNPLGHVTTQAYDVFGRPGQSTVQKTATAIITTPAPVYDGNDNITQSTLPTGAVTNYSYNAGDELTTQLAPPDTSTATQPKTTYTYDPAGNVLTETSPDGNVTGATGTYTTTLGYDAINELTSFTDANGDQTSYGYDNAGNRTSVTDPDGNKTTYDFNLNHWQTGSTDAAGNTTSVGYDLDGKVISTTAQNGATTQFTLDPRGDVVQVKVPHTAGSSPVYNTTQYVYDQAGNKTQTLTPRAIAAGTSTASACVETQTCPFTYVTKYDADNRVSAQQGAYNSADPVYNTPATTYYCYDAAGDLSAVSAPPAASSSCTGASTTNYSYFDNGWVQSSTDPSGVATSYDYNDAGQQSLRKITSADGQMSRTENWAFYPGGQMESQSDDGVPTGLYSEMVDNSDAQNTSSSGTWTTSSAGSGFQGQNYATHAAGTGTDSFTWDLNIPASGNYTVYVKFPQVSGAATNASYKVNYSGGSATVTKDQTSNNNGNWIALGTYAFTQTGSGQQVTLSENSGGTVVADAVTAVRDNSADTNTAHHDFTYSYDPDGNQTQIADSSPGTPIDNYAMTYNGIDQLTKVLEQKSGVTQHTTTYGYDAAGNLTSRGHDGAVFTYTYNNRNLLASESDATSASDPSPQVSTFTYAPTGQLANEVKPNGNTVAYSYFADGLPETQTEDTSGGTLVDSHVYTYDPDGNKATDVEKVMSADSSGSYLQHTLAYTYDPMDRITRVTTDGAITEQYTHDASGNVTSQTIGTTQTSFSYNDDNQVISASSGGIAATNNYDPLGRLDSVTAGNQVLQSDTYDGFDNLTSQQQFSNGSYSTTNYTYDPLNRVSSQTSAGTTTNYAYLGLSSQLTAESQGGSVTKSYDYTPNGTRLSQTIASGQPNAGPGYYTYDSHSDVEAVTGASGDTTATYGYTSYGQPIASQFTGADKNTVNGSPTAQPYSAYRFNAMRWDSSSGQYDMGFRNYDPGLNQFLSRDMYDGALADMNLSTDPFTGNRYTFGGGNPISNIELDGHMFPGGGGSNSCPPPELICSPSLFSAVTGTNTGAPAGIRQVVGAPVAAPPLLSPPEAPPVDAPPVEAPPVDAPGGGGLLTGIVAALGLLLSGDSAQNQQPLQVNTKDRSQSCFGESFATRSSIIYYNMDYSYGQGRATGVEACLSPSASAIDTRPPPTPAGFQSGMDRGHLIARRFGGLSIPENTVPLWPAANQRTMAGIENKIAGLLALGQRVYYTASPVYAPSEPYVPIGINITYGTDIIGLRNQFVANAP